MLAKLRRFDHIFHPTADGPAVKWRMDAAAANILNAALPGRGNTREDANETLAFARSLEYINTEAYRYLYPEPTGRNLLPINYSVPNGATSHTYRMLKEFGEAELIHSYANDFPRVDMNGSEATTKIVSFGDAYEYNIMDLRQASLLKMQIDSEKAILARKACERKLDKYLALGEPLVGLNGLTNVIPGGQAVTASTKAVTGTAWTNAAGALVATPQEVLNDVNAMANKIWVDTKGIFNKVRLLLDTKSFAAISTTPVSPTFRDKMVLQFLLDSCPWLESIQHWNRLDTAGADGKGRAVCFVPQREVIEAFVPQDFEQFPPQARNLAFVVNCHMRFGGVVLRYTQGAVYMDGLNP